jgi:hypothetical protein
MLILLMTGGSARYRVVVTYSSVMFMPNFLNIIHINETTGNSDRAILNWRMPSE